jgi:septal ring factor EnvC (AmiA/AmiB activator)
MSVSALSERLEAHIEETERQFASVNASVANSQVSIDTLTKTVSDFISVHNALDSSKKDRKIELWQWLAILGAFAGPSLVEKLLKVVGF